jgi:hypothetical protein
MTVPSATALVPSSGSSTALTTPEASSALMTSMVATLTRSTVPLRNELTQTAATLQRFMTETQTEAALQREEIRQLTLQLAAAKAEIAANQQTHRAEKAAFKAAIAELPTTIAQNRAALQREIDLLKQKK